MDSTMNLHNEFNNNNQQAQASSSSRYTFDQRIAIWQSASHNDEITLLCASNERNWDKRKLRLFRFHQITQEAQRSSNSFKQAKWSIRRPSPLLKFFTTKNPCNSSGTIQVTLKKEKKNI
ncbi:unnamed protein product [Gongylonema pulchrum]|uniref:Uncharacterized protein n=1 Tax=Gongylonema pulchrum TaxID=637853 RepID=A0A183F158_9BILA|nr:unnamed protein product [Gongylonema pulchrum]